MTTTSRNQESNIGPSVGGIARSVLFLVFFGALWASIGINGLNRLEEPWLEIVAMFIGLALLIAGVLIIACLEAKFHSGTNNRYPKRTA